MISYTLYLQSLFITLARYCSIISCAHLLHKNISLYSAHRQLWQYELLKPLVLTIIGILLTRELADKTEIISWSADYSTLPLLTIILSIFIFFLGYLYKNFFSKKTTVFLYSAWFMHTIFLYWLPVYEYEWLKKRIFEQECDLHGQVTELLSQSGEKSLRVRMHCSSISQSYTFYNCSFDLLVYVTNNKDFITIGSALTIKKIALFAPQKNDLKPTGLRDYIIQKKALAFCFAQAEQLVIHPQQKHTFWQFLAHTREQLCSTITKKLSTRAAYFFTLIFLGKNQSEPDFSLNHSFNLWGISHYLARSGLHIALLLLIWVTLLNVIPVNIFYKRIFLLVITTLYALLSWQSCSFLRSYFLFALICIGKLFYYQPKSSHLLLLLCLSMLLVNPIQGFFLDFQLTFLLTFALMITLS